MPRSQRGGRGFDSLPVHPFVFFFIRSKYWIKDETQKRGYQKTARCQQRWWLVSSLRDFESVKMKIPVNFRRIAGVWGLLHESIYQTNLVDNVQRLLTTTDMQQKYLFIVFSYFKNGLILNVDEKISHTSVIMIVFPLVISSLIIFIPNAG